MFVRSAFTGVAFLRRLVCLSCLFVLSLSVVAPSRCFAETNSAAIYLDALLDFENYAETIWHTANYANSPANSGYFGDGASAGNGGIRGSCGVAVAYAVLVYAQPGDARNATRISRITQALNYAANTHASSPAGIVCVDGKRWGHDWQTALWGGSMGLACVLVESNLPAATVQAVKRAVGDESNYRAAIAPASGYVGDTKAEENAWDSNILALSAAWMSSSNNAALWLTGAKKYLANSYTVANTNGDPLSSWVTTVTLYPDYALENHGFYHPTYEMVAGMSLGDSLLTARLANSAVAAELQPFAEHNVMKVWYQLSDMVLDSGEFAYPSGLDWALHDFEQNSCIAWIASHFNDPLARWANSQLAKCVRFRQLVNGDGRFVGESEPNGFYREAVEARRTAIAWLHITLADFPTGPMTTPQPSVTRYDDVGIITHRSQSGFFSVSYGSRIMAMIEAPALNSPTNGFLASPKLPGVLGLGSMGSPTAAQLVSFATNSEGFDAELTLQNGSQGSTEVYIKSTGETVAIVEVPLPYPGASTTPAGSFSIGIENDPLTGGSRLLEWSGGSTTIQNRSGTSKSISNQWVCVAGRYGLAAGPAGYFLYQAAGSYNRLGAAEDTLQFVPQAALGARYAVWFPGKNAAQTMTGASSISWSAYLSSAALTFPGPGGSPRQINVTIPSQPPYPPYGITVSSISASSSQSAYPPALAIDGASSTFWVSSGTTQGQGPTSSHPESLSFVFPRSAAIMGVDITPRMNYGPKTLQVLIGTNAIYNGSMSNATLSIRVPEPVAGTNAQIIFTASYDPSYPNNSRNVQVAEVVFLERAEPGTFGDWAIRNFTDAQLALPDVGTITADPDHDSVPNLLEFATGGDPFAADSSSARAQGTPGGSGMFALRFTERKDLGDVERHFEHSDDLMHWTEISPASLAIVGNQSATYEREALFPMQSGVSYYRVKYSAP